MVLGDAGYYGRFGFVFDGALAWPPAEPGHLGVVSFGNPRPRGVVHYASAFGLD